MDIHNAIKQILINSEEIRKAYPTVTNVRHELTDIPYSDLKQFANENDRTLHIDNTSKRAYVIHSPFISGRMDTDIWLYSTTIQITPQQIIEENGQGDTY